MNDSVSILLAVFLILIAIRWLLGGNTPQQQLQQRSRSQRIHRVTPQMIDHVRHMFPDIPEDAIRSDLERTGAVELTVDNALRDGMLPLPSNAHEQTVSNSSNGTDRKSFQNLLVRYKIEPALSGEMNEPPKVWNADPNIRQELLKNRKEYMVLQARKKLLEKNRGAEPGKKDHTS